MSMSDFGGVQNEGFIETRGCLSSTQIVFVTAYQIIESVHELQLRLFTRLFRNDQLPLAGYSALDTQDI